MSRAILKSSKDSVDLLIFVRDIKKSLDFYRRILGLEPAGEVETPFGVSHRRSLPPRDDGRGGNRQAPRRQSPTRRSRGRRPNPWLSHEYVERKQTSWARPSVWRLAHRGRAPTSRPGIWRLKAGGYFVRVRVTDPRTGRLACETDGVVGAGVFAARQGG